MQATGATKKAHSDPYDHFSGPLVSMRKEDIVRLSTLNVFAALRAIVEEWVGVFAAIWICQQYWHPLLYLLAIFYIGTRQHALFVLNHDGVHYRYHKNRKFNDFIANLFTAWPRFTNLEIARFKHAPHHNFLGTEKDSDRWIHQTHRPDGTLTEDWTFPKSIWKFLGLQLRRASGPRGISIVLGGYTFSTPLKELVKRHTKGQVAFYLGLSAILSYFGWWTQFFMYWAFPFCTIYVALLTLRITIEHYGVPGEGPKNLIRTTVAGFLGKILIMPRNIGYHVEHHLYPSIPFYNLPEAHRILMENPSFLNKAHVNHGVGSVFRELIN